jgi:nicotinate phosphoribosyltransferase
LTTSSDAPALDCAYKLQEYAGIARRKRSAGKETWPGRKQVWRTFGTDGVMMKDAMGLEEDRVAGKPLLRSVLRAGKRVAALPSLAEIRDTAAQSLHALPKPLSRLEEGFIYPVDVTAALRKLAAECDRRAAPAGA